MCVMGTKRAASALCCEKITRNNAALPRRRSEPEICSRSSPSLCAELWASVSTSPCSTRKLRALTYKRRQYVLSKVTFGHVERNPMDLTISRELRKHSSKRVSVKKALQRHSRYQTPEPRHPVSPRSRTPHGDSSIAIYVSDLRRWPASRPARRSSATAPRTARASRPRRPRGSRPRPRATPSAPA